MPARSTARRRWRFVIFSSRRPVARSSSAPGSSSPRCRDPQRPVEKVIHDLFPLETPQKSLGFSGVSAAASSGGNFIHSLSGSLPLDVTAAWLTFRLAATTTLLLAVIGLPLAWWLAAPHGRSAGLRGLVEAVCTLPLVLPPTVAGFFLLVATAPQSVVGRLWGRLTGGTLPFTFSGILLAAVLMNLPYAIGPFTAAFAALDRRLVEASWCLGESRSRDDAPRRPPCLLAGNRHRPGDDLRPCRRGVRRRPHGRGQYPRHHPHPLGAPSTTTSRGSIMPRRHGRPRCSSPWQAGGW